MSHFTVLVVGEDPEKQLAPFQENNMGDCPREYMKYHVVDKETYETKEVLDGERPLAEGEEGYWENPNRKWDWYSLGGRWTGFFKVKEGSTYAGLHGKPGVPALVGGDPPPSADSADMARKGDIDWNAMAEENRERLGKWYDEHWSETQLVEIYGYNPAWSREEFIGQYEYPSTFAVLKDGKWYEKGQMGWWGIVTDGKPEDQWLKEWAKLVKGLPDDTLLSVYDCHI